MILGGSCLFLIAPTLAKNIFFYYPEEGQVLNIFYQLGLIFFMFLSGYNTEIKIDKKNAKLIVSVLIGATILPMIAVIPFINVFKDSFIGSIHNNLAFSLVFCIGVAITSIPVISKIFFDMGIMNTKFSNTILTVAAFQDLCLWILLNIATNVATTGKVKLSNLILVVVITLGLFILITFMSKLVKETTKKMNTKLLYSISFILVLFICAILSKVGINIMYSAFIVGYFLRYQQKKIQKFLTN